MCSHGLPHACSPAGASRTGRARMPAVCSHPARGALRPHPLEAGALLTLCGDFGSVKRLKVLIPCPAAARWSCLTCVAKTKGFCAGDLFGGRDSREQEWLTGKVKQGWKEVAVGHWGSFYLGTLWGPGWDVRRCPPEVSKGESVHPWVCLPHRPGVARGVDYLALPRVGVYRNGPAPSRAPQGAETEDPNRERVMWMAVGAGTASSPSWQLVAPAIVGGKMRAEDGTGQCQSCPRFLKPRIPPSC